MRTAGWLERAASASDARCTRDLSIPTARTLLVPHLHGVRVTTAAHGRPVAPCAVAGEEAASQPPADLVWLWKQPAASGAVVAAPCDDAPAAPKPPPLHSAAERPPSGSPLLVRLDEWRAMGAPRLLPDPVRQLQAWRAKRGVDAEAADQASRWTPSTMVSTTIRALIGALPATALPRRPPLSAPPQPPSPGHEHHLVASLPILVRLGSMLRQAAAAIECLPPPPLHHLKPPPGWQPPSAHAQPAARHLLSVVSDDDEDVDLDAFEDLDAEESVAKRAAALSPSAKAHLPLPPRRFSLPPPLPSAYFAGLPPALPPLPAPLSSLLVRPHAKGASSRHSAAPRPSATPARLEERLHALPPPLPPPGRIGAQCFPERASECAAACDGGTCECDLYPDYVEGQPAELGDLMDDLDEGWSLAADTHGRPRHATPPARHTLFFNSNFRGGSLPPSTHRKHASPPDTAPRPLSGHRDDHKAPPRKTRRLGEARADEATASRKSAPSLRLLCSCACPAQSPL